jgi:DNA repair exonuclease SbcCD nuclease subunit
MLSHEGRMRMPLRFAHAGDFHLDEDRYFADTAQCLEWLVADAVQANVDLFVINGDLTTYKATIKERNLWVNMLIWMATHAPVILVAGNHGAELEGDLYVFAKVRGKHPIYLCTDPDVIGLDKTAVAVFPYPRKAAMAGDDQNLREAFARQLDEFNQRFAQRPGCYKLFFGHFGVAGAKVSSGQPLVGRCVEYPHDPLRSLKAQYVGLSHVHLRQQLAPRIWYTGSLSRCDYSEVEDKGYHLVTLNGPDLCPDLSDLNVEFRVSPTRRMVELHAVYEDGELQLPDNLDLLTLKDSRVKVVVTVPNGPDRLLSHEQQENLRKKLLAANPAELKVKIEHDTDLPAEPAPIAAARSAEEKLRAYWAMKGTPPADRQERLLAKLAEVENAVLSSQEGVFRQCPRHAGHGQRLCRHLCVAGPGDKGKACFGRRCGFSWDGCVGSRKLA